MAPGPFGRPGLAFMTFHFHDEVQVNNLTIDATDPQVRHGRVQGDGHPRREAGVARPGRVAQRVRRRIASRLSKLIELRDA
jgi:hypothetical protein